LSAQIHTMNDEIQARPASLPPELSADASAYARAMKILAEQLPPGVSIQHVSAADNALNLTLRSGGSDWLNRFIEGCQSRSNLKILTSKISHGEGVTEIELLVEMR